MNILQTKRLLLREFTLNDLDNLYELYRNPVLMQYITGEPRSYEKTCERLLAHITDQQKYGFGLWATILKSNGRFIGRCGLEPVEDNEGLYGDIAWMFQQGYWGMGLGTEVGSALIDYGFSALGLNRIIATAHPDNVASIRVMEKIGMRQQEVTSTRVTYLMKMKL